MAGTPGIFPPVTTARLSKSKLMAGLQCPKRLWLEVHRPELLEYSADAEQRFTAGHEVNDVARSLHAGGILIDIGHTEGNLQETRRLLTEGARKPLFEATFQYDGVLVRTDILTQRRERFTLTEVKSGGSVKPPYYPDCAVQAWVLVGAGLDLHRVRLAHIDTKFVYQGDGNYRGLFADNDLTAEIEPFQAEVPTKVRGFKKVLAGREPDIAVGDHCAIPYECPFMDYCAPAQPDYPVTCLPRGRKTARKLQEEGILDIRDIPEGRLSSATHEWVRNVTRSGRPDLRIEELSAIRDLPFPRYYLDFETVGFAVPIWADTRPYQQLPFQWSVHVESADGGLQHQEFLDTSGEAPMRRVAEQLIKTLGRQGPVVVYSSFERTQLKNLAACSPDLRNRLNAIIDRLFDLLPIMQRAWYHPDMLGSWSIKAVLPTIAPHLDYSALGEVQDGGSAMLAYREMIHPRTAPDRRTHLEADLLRYCAYDTLAMVEIVRFLSKALR